MANPANRLLNQSMLLRLVAAAYAYPDEDFREALRSGAFSTALCSGVTRLADARLSEQAERLYQAIASLPDAQIGLEEEYTALFQRKVPCSPYSSRYLVPSAIYRSRVLSEVGHYYRVLGLRPAVDRPDLPDHIGAELEFLGLAAAREYEARQDRKDEAAERFREMRERFCRDHVLCWVPIFRQRLGEHARLDFYPTVTDVAVTLLAVDQPAAVEDWDVVAADALAGDAMESDDGTGSSFECGVVAGAGPVDRGNA